GPVAALSFATVFVALGHKEIAQRNMHTDEFAQTRLALLEQESFKRKVQEGRNGQDPSKPASETDSTLEENLPESISIRKSTRNPYGSRSWALIFSRSRARISSLLEDLCLSCLKLKQLS